MGNPGRDMGNGFALAGHPPASYFSRSITSIVAYQMDTKMDDGLPLTGKVGVNKMSVASQFIAETTATAEASTAIYEKCYETTNAWRFDNSWFNNPEATNSCTVIFGNLF